MAADIDKLRELAERYARKDANEDLDSQEWGEAMPPWDVLALLDRIAALEVARDEACDIAWWFTQPAQIGISDSREVGQQIRALRRAGT